MVNLDDFVNAYMVAALWSSTDENGEPLDSDCTVSDIAETAAETMRADCANFVATNGADLDAYTAALPGNNAGHDFWLTRNHHGAGFWDRGLAAVGDRLTNAAHAYGSCDLYIGDDGKVYL